MDVCNLPSELLLMIFSYLSYTDKGNVSRVCHKWKALAYHCSLWRHAVFHFRTADIRSISALLSSLKLRKVHSIIIDNNLSKKALHRRFLEGCSKFVKYLELRRFSVGFFSSWNNIPQFTNLECLDISYTSLTNICLSKLLTALPFLKQLNAENLDHDVDTNETWIEIIVDSTHRTLCDLNIAYTNLCLNGIRHIFQENRFLQLRRLNVSGNKCIALIPYIQKHMTSLNHLDISSMSLSNLHINSQSLPSSLKSLSLASNRVELTLSSFSTMQALDISNNLQITNETIQYVVNYMPQLHVLKLSNCFNVTDLGANLIASHLVQLRVLNVNYVRVTDMAIFLDCVALHLTALSSLSCVGCNVAPSVLHSKLKNTHIKYLTFRDRNITEVRNCGKSVLINTNNDAEGLKYFMPESSYLL